PLSVSTADYHRAFLRAERGTFLPTVARALATPPADPVRFHNLLRLSGDGAPEAASDLEQWLRAFPELARLVNYCERIGNRRWNLHLSNQLVVELPDSGLDEALAVLMRMISKDDLLNKDIVQVDLRDPRGPRLILGD